MQRAASKVHWDAPCTCRLNAIKRSELRLGNQRHVVADRIVRNWTHVARKLGVDEKNIQMIETNEKRAARERSFQMLLHWKESKHDSATVECLCKALLEENKKETVGEVFKVVSN